VNGAPPLSSSCSSRSACSAVSDAQEILRRFFSWLHDLSLADGARYRSEEEREAVMLGVRRHHSADYRLHLEGTDLGAITLFRRERFSENELLLIEQALGAVGRCLKSALEFTTLTHLVQQDSLTGLGNRLALTEWLTREVQRARRHHNPLSLLMIDVDHFKDINDALGHLGGDHVLRGIAAVFKRCTRGSDLLFRYGGDEFTILLPHTDLQGAVDAARHIHREVARLDAADFGLAESALPASPGLSIGVTTFNGGDDEQTLMARADANLYRAKAEGRGRVYADA
jgi:diguanylate cyclase (GGDEF)-like protein